MLHESYLLYIPKLLICLDVPRCKEADAWEAQVLMLHEYFDGDDVWLTEVINEASDVAVLTRIDAVRVLYLAHIII